MTTDYIVNLKGNTSDLEKVLKKAEGSIKRLSDDEVLIKLAYDGNLKGFNKTFDKVLKACPELSIQFQYEVNKKLLEQEVHKLDGVSQLSMDIDTGAASGKIKEMVSSIQSLWDSAAGEKELFSAVKQLLQYANTVESLGFNVSRRDFDIIEDVAEEYESVSKLVSENEKNPIKLFDVDENTLKNIEKTKENIKGLEENIEKLKKQGASDLSENDEFKKLSDEVKILRSDLDDMKVQMESLSGEAFEEMAASAERLENKLSAALERIKELENQKINPNNISFHVGDLDISNPNRWKSESMNRVIQNMNAGSFDEGDYGYGILGTGVYHTPKAKELALSKANPKGFALNIDPSKYKLLTAKIDEEAEKYMEFLSQLQGYVVAQGSGYDGWDDVLKGVDTDSLYSKFTSAFGETAMDIKEFSDFVDSMISEVAQMAKYGFDEAGNFNLKGTEFDHADTPVTKLLKKLGYEGVDFRGTSYDSYEQGSTIFDLHPEDITQIFDTQDEMYAFWKQNKESVEKFNTAAAQALGDAGQSIITLTQYVKELNEQLELLSSRVKTLEDLGVVTQTAEGMAEAGVRGIQEGQDSNSPSKDTGKEGDNFVEGFVSHIEDGVDDAKKAADDLASSAVDELNKGISGGFPRNIELNLDYSDLAQQYKQVQDDYVKQAFNADIENTNLGKINQLLVEGHQLMQKEVDDIVEATQAQVAQVSLAERFDDAVKEYVEDLSKAENNSEELATSLKAAMEATKSAEGGSSLEFLDDLHTYEAELAEGYREAEEQREKVLKKTEQINEAIIDAINKRQKAEKEAAEKSEKDAEKAEKAKQKAAEKTVESLTNQAQNYLNSSKYSQKVNEDAQELLNTFQRLSTQDVINEEDIKEATLAFQQLKQEASLATGKAVNPNKLSNIINEIDKYSRKYSGLSDKTKASLDAVIQAMKEAPNDEVFKSLYRDFLNIQQAARAAGEETQTSFKRIGDRLKDMNAKFIAQFFSIQDIIRYVRELADAVVELDSALTELRKVSDASTERLQQSFEKSAITAQELGSTISDVINITSDWARLGYDVDAAEELARVTTLFKTVGDNMTADDASSYLVSTMQGFQIAADQAETIVDKYNQVANNFAIDTKGIGEALQRSAASFNAANTDLSKSIALITATNEVVQNPESVGTLWKTMSARIRGAKTELEDLNEETDEYTETTSKLRDLVMGLTGFDIMEDKDTFKDIYEIIMGIGKEWDKLTDIERASLGEALAGKRNANALYAVLGNLDTLEAAYAEAEKAAGSARKEQENYAQSIQYSIDRFKASVEELSYDFLNSQFLKNAIEFANTLIRALDEVIEHTDALADILLALSVFLGVKFKKEISSLASFAIKQIKSIGGAAMASGAVSTELTAFQAGLAALGPYAGVIAGITAALVVGAAAWDAYETTVAEAQKELDDTSSKIEDLQEEIKELKGLDYRTEEQETRLKSLEKELEFQEKIYEIEKKRVLQEKVGSKFTDWFDKDNYNNQLLREANPFDELGTMFTLLGANGIGSALNLYSSIISPDSFADMLDDYSKNLEKLDSLSKLRQDYTDYLNKNQASMSDDEINEYIKSIKDLDKQIEDLNGEDIVFAKDLNSKAKEFKDTVDYLQQAIEEGLVTGSDRENAEKLVDEYTSAYQEIYTQIAPLLRAEGIFDYGSIISSTLSDAEFKGIEDQLVQLAKEGTLSGATLEHSFSNLVEVLALAGVKTEELRDYILELAGITNVSKISKGLAQKLNTPEYDENGFALTHDAAVERQAALLEKRLQEEFTDEEIALIPDLELDVDGMDVEPAIAEIKKKINDSRNTPIKVGVELDTSKFLEIDDDLEKLQSLYEQFRGNVEGNELKVPLDISDVESLPDTWKQLESFKDFELKVTTSTNVDEVQKAFDDFATDYARNSIKIQGLTKETMDMVKAQMKMDGLEEGGVNKLVDSLAAEEKMNEFVDALEKGADAEGNMEDSALDSAVAIYEEAKALGLSDDMLVDYLKEAALAGNIVIDGDEAWLYTLADALDMDIAKLRELLGLAQQGSGYATSYDSAGNKHVTSTYMPNGTNAKDWAAQQQQWRNEEKWRNVTNTLVNPSKTSGGGGSDEDPYIKQFEEELKKLDELRDRGLITEKEYLNKQKELIDKFFKDREKYAEEYAKRLADYLKNMQTYYNSVISGVTTLIDHRISSLQSERDSVVDSLTEEKEAAMERYQAEIDAIDSAIKAKEKEKEKLQDQIDAIEKANAARDRAINLQKAEYELQRAMNQRTRLVYTGEPGQMVYERDESAVRDKQEAKQDALDEIAKAKIQEQIDLIDKEIARLNEEREALQAQMEAVSKYYDTLIKQQEKMFDEMIKKLEDTKKKWEELAEIESIANAWGLVQNEMKEFGFTVEDVLNDTPGAFEAFRDAYISNLAKMHENDQGFLDGLSEITGKAKDTFGQLADSAGTTQEAMSKIAEATAPLSDAAGNIKAVGDAATTASDGVGKLKDATEGIADNLNNMDTSACETFQECVEHAQEKVKELIDLISGENGIKGAIESLNNSEMLSAIGTSFTELGKAIGSVATALGVSTGGENSGEGGDNTSSRSASMSEGSDESQGGGGKGLVGAIEEIKNATDTYIGTEAETEGENAIGSFVALKTAVDNVTTAIGQGDEEGGGGKGGKGGEGEGGGDGTLTAAITSLQQTTADSLVADGDNGVIGMFETLAAAIEKCLSAASELLDVIEKLAGNGVDVGSLNFGYSGTAYPHYEGTAKLSGDWSVRDNERALVGELGQELVVDSKTGRFRTVGDNGPEFVNLRRGDIVFNHLQTRELLSKKNLILPKGSHALASGTVFSPISGRDLGGITSSIPTFSEIRQVINDQTKAIQMSLDSIGTAVSSNTPSITVNNPSFTVSGVTGEQVMRQIEGSFEGLMLNAYQKAMS